MLFLLTFLVNIVFAEPVLTSESFLKSDARKVLLNCQKALRAEKQIDIRNSRFFVKGVGYRQRIMISGFNNERHALKVAGLLENETGKLSYIADDGRKLTYDSRAKAFVGGIESIAPPLTHAKPQNNSTGNSSKNIVVRIVPKIEKKAVDNNLPLESDPNPANVVLKPKKTLLNFDPTSEDLLMMANGSLKMMHEAWSSSKSEMFEFNRVLHDVSLEFPITAKHTYLRDGDAMRLEVQIENGTGQDSTTVLTRNGESWILVGEKTISRNAARTKEILKRFSSESLLSILIKFPSDIQSKGSWRNLNDVQKSEDLWQLRVNSKVLAGIIEADFQDITWDLRRVKVLQEDGVWEYQFTDYRPLNIGINQTVSVPHQLKIIKDAKIIEEIGINKIQLNMDISKELFQKKI